jgi:probable poly-beta-1,6-N-acetyl-D-glucosamine export protein
MQRHTTDLARLFTMLAVCLIHGTGSAEWRFFAAHDYVSEDGVAVTLNQLARFSVPLFVLLSGYGLAASRLQSSRKEGWLGEFVRGRLLRIGLPYLVVTLAFELQDGRLTRHTPPVDALRTLAGDLVRGGADYHLYFLPIILQCCVLFPLLMRWYCVVLWPAVLLSLVLAAPSYAVAEALGLPVPTAAAHSFVHWLGYFCAGMALAHRTHEGRPLAPPWGLAAGAAVLVGAFVVGEYFWWSYRVPNPGWVGHFLRWSVIAYVGAVTALLLALDRPISRCVARAPAWARRLGVLSGLTFPVYLFHTRILRVLSTTPLDRHPLVQTAVLVTLALVLVAVADRLLPGDPLRAAVGLPPRARAQRHATPAPAGNPG